ncbi:sulfite exporter TauE/SafE family protein [Oceanimonas pelagia]|uniref:Probable membrane transporter protein n=1 Tax=Oceanimonas pelagia TaxID=3028314 RepID=A0AA50KNI4_9GAMM|nr:sulfite exporter TauE/SafE family protein [Oceanimonas pelagia]WMC10257.1 sulfite exporter TauE/SafE family protein [Oceanimonas pelagia]
MELLASLLLSPLDAASTLTLLILSAVTSCVSALLGFGGGVLLLVVMANLIDPISLIAVHGLVQLGSNASRIYAYRYDLALSFTKTYLLGALMGALVATMVVAQLPPSLLLSAVGLFVLVSAWLPTGVPIRETRSQILGAGAGVTFLSMFVGSTGPLMASIMKGLNFSKATFVGTIAVCLLGQNLMKTLVFGSLGFDPFQWLPLVVMMIFTGFIGTWLGARLMGRLNEQRFGLILKWAMTLIAIKLLGESFLSEVPLFG